MKGLDVQFVKILIIFTAIDFSGNDFEGRILDKIGQFHAPQLVPQCSSSIKHYQDSSYRPYMCLEQTVLGRSITLTCASVGPGLSLSSLEI